VVVSLRILLTGLTVEAVIVRSAAELGWDLALVGGFLFVADGEGDGIVEIAPLVCIPGGGGRFTLLAAVCWATTGAMIGELAFATCCGSTD
jgi:hypothetical protein